LAHRQRHTSKGEQLFAPGPQERLASEAQLWARFAEHRDPSTREELVWRYMPLARNLTGRYRAASEPAEDLLQVASLGLMNAVDRFDPARGIPFSAFASPTILGELKRHFRDRAWTVRVPRSLHDRIAAVSEAIEKLTKVLQRSPSVGEIAAHLELQETEVLEVLEASQNRRPLSLDRPGGADDEDEALGSEWIGAEDGGFELVENRASLSAAIPDLDERERLVLRLRFVEDMTQVQIAARIGHSQMHVSRILRRALEHIRERIGEERPALNERAARR
jgi:RNA polymerase sigma-B factor